MKKMDIHNLTSKDIKKLHVWLRILIQVLYFLFLPSVYTAAFAGVKYIFTQIGAGEKIAMTSFVAVLLVICIYTILFGRFFCGFACAFGSLGDGVHALYVWVCKKMKKGKTVTEIAEDLEEPVDRIEKIYKVALTYNANENEKDKIYAELN